MKFINLIFFSIVAVLLTFSCHQNKFPKESQITHDLTYNHDLDNNDNFSPDDQWLVYDTRTEEGGIGGCSRIEKVNVVDGEKVVLYELEDNQSYGPGVGAVSYSHTENAVVFIHGLMNITEENSYQQWRRTGVIVEDERPGIPIMMDARDVTFPYTPGALRGGTHRHEWSRDGGWIGYTYNDAIMKTLEDSTGELANLRTIGVSKRSEPVEVDSDFEEENNSGGWFSALVVHVVPDPVPGSDEISRAAGDSWVGVRGYQKEDGTWQRARAFIGTTIDQQGQAVDEVYIVDIPEKIEKAGPLGPLSGTKSSLPMPPEGAAQRRLTFTADTKQPGCTGVVRSSADGSMLAYLAKDEKDIMQVYLISPLGGTPRKLTDHASDVQGNPRWHPAERAICYVWDNSVVLQTIDDAPETSAFKRLTLLNPETPPSDLVWSHDGTTIAYNRLVSDGKGSRTKQIFLVHP